ncbi:MAG: type II toxin-antitoxin system VapC family toxin [Nitrospirae bacterium]|nr:type II toxin-antitoxin system VapC family toxin [Nitrospirota bacterium]MBI3392466.1 type II toxin-antitoxin system VapC family toxin [Nitrospirota bacterium]
MIYFDTSALVKRYVKEKGSIRVDSLLADADSAATSRLTYPEMLSAFHRRWREGAYSEDWLNRIVANFETEWDNFIVIDFQEAFYRSTKDLIRKYSLKGADSVHLSSALWLKRATGENLTFAACDKALLDAARTERLEAENPGVGE